MLSEGSTASQVCFAPATPHPMASPDFQTGVVGYTTTVSHPKELDLIQVHEVSK